MDNLSASEALYEQFSLIFSYIFKYIKITILDSLAVFYWLNFYTLWKKTFSYLYIFSPVITGDSLMFFLLFKKTYRVWSCISFVNKMYLNVRGKPSLVSLIMLCKWISEKLNEYQCKEHKLYYQSFIRLMGLTYLFIQVFAWGGKIRRKENLVGAGLLWSLILWYIIYAMAF